MTKKNPAPYAKKKKNSRITAEDVVLDVIIYVSLILLCVTTLYPFINTVAIAFNNAIDTVRGGVYLWPRVPTLRNFEKILIGNPMIKQAIFISASRAVIGCIASVFANFCVAYVLSRKDFFLRRAFTPFLVFTMYFSGGLIPSYLLMINLGLMNNFLVYILPAMISAYNVMVMRSYIEGLPDSLIEAAKIDGASEYRILFSIIWPLSMPVIATIALFVSVGQWNSWFDTMLYASNPKSGLTTLQYELQKLMTSAQSYAAQDSDAALANVNPNDVPVTPSSIRAAMTVIAVTPILFVYPFLQKYFVTGLTLGGVKG